MAVAISGERTGSGESARYGFQGRASGRDRPGVANVNYNWMEPARTVRIWVDQDQARLLGLSSEQLAESLNAVVSGVATTQVRSGIYLVDVVVRASADAADDAGDASHIAGPASRREDGSPGARSPLSNTARSTRSFASAGPPADRDRTGGCDVRDAGRHARARARAEDGEAVKAELPNGYRLELGGTAEERDQQSSLSSPPSCRSC